ncbi:MULTISPECIES: MFS transporter [unclassified Novosphingobium]|uniref:spinster family MFS transporter n=1 Tax=unclassified Novosphingobium TaxID=2644732 RepID=UPI000EECC6E2|nr:MULTISPECIES: MFS transporter [unclassified Novosphingobium]HCF24832.1 MFS transporter [Novosphingobium sp.]HQV01956.1 MFS transporter [Novosphingobium sp.]
MATKATPEGVDTPTLGQRWYVLIIMMLVYTISIADRYVLSTLLGPISKEFGLSDTETAWLGIPLALFYVVMGIPLSWLCDRSNRTRLLAASVAIWSFMTAVTGYTKGYFDLLLARVGVGIGEAGGTPACNAIIADYFPADRRSMAMTVFALGAPLGAWLGSDIAGYVSTLHGWRAAFLVLGVPGIILALIILVTIKEPVRGRLDAVTEEKAPTVVETIKFLWSQKSAVHALWASGLSAFWGWGLMWFTPLFLQRTYGMNEGEAGGLLGWIYMFGGIGASLLTAWVVARPAYTDPRKIARLLAVVTGLATIPSFLAYYTHDLGMAKLMWWLFIPAIYFYIGPAFALCQNLSSPRMRAMTVAISLLIANVLNLIVAPWIVGSLSDYFAAGGPADAASLRLAQLVLAPTGLWAAFHYWRAEKYIVEDQKRAIGYV